MKTRLLLFALFILCHYSYAQTSTDEQKNIEQKLMRNWVKYRVEMKDGSQVVDEKMAKVTASMLIFKKNNVGVVIFGRDAQQMKYSISSSLLVLDGNTSYNVEKLTENELIFTQNYQNVPDNKLVKYTYVATKESAGEYFYRQFIKPNIVIKPNEDTVYRFSEYIFPKFKDKDGGYAVTFSTFEQVYESTYNLIEKNFAFPAKTAGNFRVTFSISKFGTLKDVEVKESSDSSYNDILLQAVYQTRKQWLPAVYNNNKVETLFNYVFRFEGENEQTNNFDLFSYQTTKERANKFFDKKEYVKAIKFYTKCILMQEEDFDFEPYYKRADSYFALKVNKNACLDWSYVAKKGQKKAENLFLENCMK